MKHTEHIAKPKDLVTSVDEIKAGFIAIALEKNRRASPYVDEARALQHKIDKISSAHMLLELPAIRKGLIAAAGISDKAAIHLGEEGCLDAIKEFIDKFLLPSGAKFKDELIFRFLLTKGDALGGKMRNIVGALAQRKLCRAIVSSLRLADMDFVIRLDTDKNWIAPAAIQDETETDKAKGISWKTPGNDPRTLYFNMIVPAVGNNIDIILLRTPHATDIKQAVGQSGNYLALGELKGGIDPAGADEHWKTAKTALDRIKTAFKRKKPAPQLFFVGAAIESKMAVEIFDNLQSGYINNAANLTNPRHITALADWLINI